MQRVRGKGYTHIILWAIVLTVIVFYDLYVLLGLIMNSY